MPSLVAERAVVAAVRAAFRRFGEDVQRLREDAAITRADLARAAGVDPSYLGRIELGNARPTIETCARLGLALGADLSARLYPTTGPLVRDRLQATIGHALVAGLHPSWQPIAEIGVQRPSRGWIDWGLFHQQQSVFVAAEIQSELRRLEQLVRWSAEKARSLPSWDGWSRLGGDPSISSLLVVRSSRATKEIARDFGRDLRAVYPAHPEDALASLVAGESWPGPSLLWAVRDRVSNDRFRIVPRP